jgi:hypothetical protein
VWDFTCADTLCRSYVLQSSQNPGAAARSAELAKRNKYKHLEPRYIFTPVAIETLGVYGEDAQKFITSIGERLKTATGDVRALAFLRQRISLAIQRGNAAAILGSLPGGKHFDEIFNL